MRFVASEWPNNSCWHQIDTSFFCFFFLLSIEWSEVNLNKNVRHFHSTVKLCQCLNQDIHSTHTHIRAISQNCNDKTSNNNNNHMVPIQFILFVQDFPMRSHNIIEYKYYVHFETDIFIYVMHSILNLITHDQWTPWYSLTSTGKKQKNLFTFVNCSKGAHTARTSHTCPWRHRQNQLLTNLIFFCFVLFVPKPQTAPNQANCCVVRPKMRHIQPMLYVYLLFTFTIFRDQIVWLIYCFDISFFFKYFKKQ